MIKSNKGNLILNNGNKSFEAQESNSLLCDGPNGQSDVLPDLDNDGFNEIYYNANEYDQKGIYVNMGDNVRFEQFQFPNTGDEYNFRFDYEANQVYDINREVILIFILRAHVGSSATLGNGVRLWLSTKAV